jgi:hypothetical protein
MKINTTLQCLVTTHNTKFHQKVYSNSEGRYVAARKDRSNLPTFIQLMHTVQRMHSMYKHINLLHLTFAFPT